MISGLVIASATIPPLFALLALMLAGVVLVSLLLLRLRQSMLAGYFICGVLIANSGVLSLLGGGESHEQVSQMAEFGVVLLMFTLGLEFSLGELRFLRKLAFVGGGLQMGLCMLATSLLTPFIHPEWQGTVILSVALAMSSTAVSLKSFQDLGLEASPGARMALAVAISRISLSSSSSSSCRCCCRMRGRTPPCCHGLARWRCAVVPLSFSPPSWHDG